MTIPLVHRPRRRSTALVGAVVAICLALTGLTAQSASAADTGSITGAVFTQAVGGAKTPVTGGYIFLHRLNADGYYDSVDSDPTDPGTDGYPFTGSTFELGGLAAGTYTFEVASVGTNDAKLYQREYYNDAEYLHDATPIQVGTTRVQLPDMVLEQAGQISGRVTDAAGKPLAGASVMFERTRSGGSKGVQTDANGYYTSVQDPGEGFGEGLVRGDYRVVASKYSSSSDPDAPSYEAEYWNNATSYDSATAVTVQPGKTATNINFTLAEAPRVRLTVKDPAGNPVPNADVGIYFFNEGAWAPYAAGPNVTGPDGVYRKTVRIGERYKFFIEPPAGVGGVTEWYDNAYSEATAREVKATSHGEVIDIEIKLGPAPVVDGSTPTITGTPQVGQQLTANPGTWGPEGVKLAYQWFASGTPIQGATQATYTPSIGDATKALTVRVTGTLANHTTTVKTSAATAPVATPAVVGSTPTITGTPEVGQQLTANPGTWGPAGVKLAYQWFANGTPIQGATQATYTPSIDDATKAITVRVTGTLANHTTTVKTSAATAPVATPPVVAPVVTGAAPVISGTPRSGSTLVASPGAWGPAGVSVAYQWLANGAPIPGATGAQLRLTNAQAGKRITVTTTGSLPGAAPVTTTSAATSAVKGVLTPKKVSITGTAKVGKKLRAKTSSWGPSPVRSSYTWYRNGKRIPGQTKSTYTLRKADAGKRITVRITRTKSNYVSAKKVSAKTGKVKKK
ncbi:carboxypeptidase-like regulatory domain-containing protein [Aeromicrobium wangtongii]|uniref:Carboxypeptidase-like regulatory domain-containing protein n=2 Tax=Aeromicrobium wangtongii TaxID=2969247 RepID=A0ABY5M3P4_9ACTN|nr:carboxypeptidase-like regulatory domain-containing protein [Aeromicrobium wangtongii]UUP12810.1 carboxypeptidase-like regulatory domain-containing protein [Aeromicrobium wangtongii]